MLQTLQQMHERAGVIHGDITPANLLKGRIRSQPEGTAAPYLLDFNASVAIGAPFSAGTPGFMPPEIEFTERKQPAHPSMDVYCAGRTFLWYLQKVAHFTFLSPVRVCIGGALKERTSGGGWTRGCCLDGAEGRDRFL